MDHRPFLAVLSSRRAELLCALLLGVMAVNLVAAIGRKSITNDETVLIPAGYYHLVAGEFHLVYEHPPLCKILAGIPLLFIQPNEFNREQLPAGSSPGETAWAYQTAFWNDNRDAFESISFWTRVPMAVLTLLLGVLLFVFTRELLGEWAAVFAVALFTFEPTVLAHGRVVQTDIAAAFGFLLLFYTMWRYSKRPTARTSCAIGAAAGIALLSKFSMVLCGPVLLVFFAVRLWRSTARGAVLRDVLLVGLTSLLVVNAAYWFGRRAITSDELASVQQLLGGAAIVIVALAQIVPAEFVLGVLWQLAHSAEGHTAGLLGMHSKTGWWYYFPVAFALKTTLPFLLLSLVALGWGMWRAVARRDVRFAWLLLPWAVYTFLLLFSGINIGVRYYIPAYMFLFMLGGAMLARLTSLQRLRALGVALALLIIGWCSAIAARTWPDYTPYMNELTAARPKWWYLSDSNIEWGDDVKPLAEWLHARGETRVRAALLGGFVTLQFYGIDYIDALADVPVPETRYVALGASFLNGSTVPEKPGRTEEERVNRFAQFRERQPEAVIGGSIYVFRVRD
jgi:4-amino-4-deoxy-L-arabinose transferase-like glycosyltransferase